MKMIVSKSFVLVFLFLMVGLSAQSAKAASIKEIDIPVLGASFDLLSPNVFTVSGLSSGTTVFYNAGI